LTKKQSQQGATYDNTDEARCDCHLSTQGLAVLPQHLCHPIFHSCSWLIPIIQTSRFVQFSSEHKLNKNHLGQSLCLWGLYIFLGVGMWSKEDDGCNNKRKGGLLFQKIKTSR